MGEYSDSQKFLALRCWLLHLVAFKNTHLAINQRLVQLGKQTTSLVWALDVVPIEALLIQCLRILQNTDTSITIPYGRQVFRSY